MSSWRIRIAIGLALLLACTRCASVPNANEIDRAAASAIAGEWGIQMKEGGHTVEGTLHFSFDGTAVVGTYVGPEGQIQELEKIRVADGRVYWQMEQKDGTLTVRGDLNGTIMSGKMKLRLRDEEKGSTISGAGGARGGYGGRASEVSFAWTAIKRAESPAP